MAHLRAYTLRSRGKGVGIMAAKPCTSAVILAGGVGSRFKHPGGKQIIELAGMPMLTWSVTAFDHSDNVGEIIVVCPEGREDEFIETAVKPFNIQTPVKVATAGAIRQESALHGLEAASDEFPLIAIHDGARPHISTETIDHAINEVKGNYELDGAIIGFPCIDTVKVIEDGMIAGTPDRNALWMANTPQVFKKDIYREAHVSALADGFVGTDDSSLVERLGGKIAALNGTRNNIKLTIPEDYEMLASSIHTMIAGDLGQESNN